VKWPLRIFVSIAAAAVLLSLLMIGGGVQPQEVLLTLARLPFGVFLAALSMHLFTYWMRAIRFRALIPLSSRPSRRRSLVVALAHNMASYTLPAKTGEASLVVYLRAHCGVPPSAGLASLFVARFLDAATVCLGLGLVCLWLQRSGQHPGLTWLGSIAALLAVMTVVFVSICARGDLVVRAVETLLRWLRVQKLGLGRHLLTQTNSLALALRSAADGRRLLVPALLSLPIWCSVFAFFFLLARYMGMPPTINFAENTLGASMGMFFNLTPVNGAAGMGTQELGWITGFHEFLGVDYDVVLSAAMGVHLVQLFNVIALGLIGHLAMGMMPRLEFADVDADDRSD